MAASGTVHTTEEATVCICDLGMFVRVQLLKESPAALSLGKLCEENCYSYEWHPGQPPISSRMGEKSNVKPTTTFLWLSQASKQPITRPKL